MFFFLSRLFYSVYGFEVFCIRPNLKFALISRSKFKLIVPHLSREKFTEISIADKTYFVNRFYKNCWFSIKKHRLPIKKSVNGEGLLVR